MIKKSFLKFFQKRPKEQARFIRGSIEIKCQYCGKYQKPTVEIESTPMRLQTSRVYYCRECHAKLNTISETNDFFEFLTFFGVVGAVFGLVLGMFDALMGLLKKFFRKLK